MTALVEHLELSFAGLVARCQSGDRAAFTPVVRAFEQPIFAFLRRMTGNPEVAADLSQETFLRAYRALPRFRPEARLRPWLFRIARNLAIDHLRERAQGFARLDLETDVEGLQAVTMGGTTAETPEALLARRRTVAAVEAAIESLRPAYREALLLHTVEGLSYEEMSQITGDTVTSLKIRVVRARIALRRTLGTETEDATDAT